MPVTRLTLVLLALVRLLLPAASGAAAAGATYYVSARGSDRNPGSMAQPWRTVQHAADTLEAGDNCVVLQGDYDERVYVTRSGRPEAPITFRSAGGARLKGFTVLADHIAIRGFVIADSDAHWRDGWGVFAEGSGVQVEFNHVYYAPAGGIVIWDAPNDGRTPSGCAVRHNRLERNGMVGVQIAGQDHVVEGNDIWGTIQYHPHWATPPLGADADGIRFFGSGHVVRANHIHDITFEDPENADPHIDCFQTWGPASDIVFEQNVCSVLVSQAEDEGGQGFMIQAGAEAVTGITIRNNVIEAFRMVNAFDCEGLTIVHNSFRGLLSFESAWHPLGVSLSRCPAATVKNNVFYDVGAVPYVVVHDGNTRQTAQVGNNATYLSSGQRPVGTPWPDDLWGEDPGLIDPMAGDMHLRTGSPCIDRADPVPGVTEDLEGRPRPQGARPDIGAYEYEHAAVEPPTQRPSPTAIYLPMVRANDAPRTTPAPSEGRPAACLPLPGLAIAALGGATRWTRRRRI